jgi:hypothetical protein
MRKLLKHIRKPSWSDPWQNNLNPQGLWYCPYLFKASEQIYTNTKARVISPDGQTQMFFIWCNIWCNSWQHIHGSIHLYNCPGSRFETRNIRKIGKTFPIHLRNLADILRSSFTLCWWHLNSLRPKMLPCVERECKKVSLNINAKTTKSLSINSMNPTSLHTTDGTNTGRWLQISGRGYTKKIANIFMKTLYCTYHL